MDGCEIIRQTFWPAIIAGILISGTNTACHSERSAAVETQSATRREHMAFDSLVRVVSARLDSPDITMVRLDSPRTIVRMKASRITVKDSAEQTATRTLAESVDEKSRKEESSSSAPPSSAWWTGLLWFLAGMTIAWFCYFRK